MRDCACREAERCTPTARSTGSRRSLGKVVVATNERDLTRLDDIHARARANGVEGVMLLDEDDLRRSSRP
jgi:L-2-hydroxyglutarate oxidase LhgO